MATPISQSLLDAAVCLECNLPPGMVPYMILAQLRTNAGLGMAIAQSDIDAAVCAFCQLSPGMVQYLILAQLITGGSGSGSVQVYTGAAPPAAPANPALPALFYPSGGGSLSQWDVGGAAWV